MPVSNPADLAIEAARQSADVAVKAAQDAQTALQAAHDALVSGQADAVADTAGAAAHAVSGGLIDPFVFRLSIFVLAIFVGYFVVWSVTPALHTPLMSVTNAISSVIIVGALLSVGVGLMAPGTGLARGFGFIAVILASVNIFGGFLVTSRMLAMYKKKG
jgi:H+-translocating NAD(P) transhydrogenase subunit alpha